MVSYRSGERVEWGESLVASRRLRAKELAR
jgi:hypothetical protein